MRYKHSTSLSVSILCAVVCAFSPIASQAGTNLITKAIQASGANWTAAIWTTNNGSGTNGTGSAVAPIAGNTYTCISNNTSIGNGVNNTRIRPPTTGAATFPGDSLTLNTNTELRFKAGSTGNSMNFPGVGGNPGLILNGGMLNGGDDATFPVTGPVMVSSRSYISHGANGGGGGVSVNRAVNFTGQLTGTGDVVIMNAGTTVPQQVSGTANTYSGRWIVQCGWLVGNTTNALGTNSILVDPNYNAYLTDMPNAVSPNGPALFEPRATLNSAGTLTLTNGGRMRLHQEVCFTAVNIHDGFGVNTSLTPGIHYYAELITNYPNSFDTGGSGALVVQPYGTPPPLPPAILAQPISAITYTNATARFAVTAADNGFPPLTYQWRRNGTNLVDGGNISGSTNAILIVKNASPADAAVGYDVVVANASFPVASSLVSLTLTSTNGEPYEAAVKDAGPFAFYQLNESLDVTTNPPAYDFVGGYTGTYGIGAQNGLNGTTGPQPGDGLPGFALGNQAAQFALLTPNSRVSVLPWNLNTNAVTITAWVNPNGAQNPNEGLVFCRGGNTVAGLCYSPVLGGGGANLGYNWNNEFDTYNWDSGLFAPGGQWSLVALVVTPTTATLYVLNTSGLSASAHAYNHVVLPFEGTTYIGDDPAGTGGNRSFSGKVDDVAVFNRALSQGEILALYSAASGTPGFAPNIAVQPPTSTNVFQGQTVRFSALAAGSTPLTYQWQAAASGSGAYTNVNDGGQFSGSATPNLTIANVDFANAADYVVWVTNSFGAVTSSIANLSIMATNSPINITMTNQEAAGADWDIGGIFPGANTNWSDLNPASYSAAQSPGNTYELLPGSRLRTPINPTVSTFPGRLLTVDGDGVWNVNPPIGSSIAEIRFKQSTYGAVNGTVNFKKLVLDGGQLDAGADAGGNNNMVIIGGQLDIQGASKVAGGLFNGDGGNDRGFRVDAQLTGAGAIEYHGYNLTAFSPTFTNNLNFTGTNNTFSGQWNVVMGTLLGTGTNALGTNHILIGTNGAVETTYSLRNTNGYLAISGAGKLYLHANDAFRSVVVNGFSLPLLAGTSPSNYSFATLNTMFPTNFPATWTAQNGVTNNTGSGSILVLASASPVITAQPQSVTNRGQLSAQLRVTAVGATNLLYQWRAGATGSGTFTNVLNGGNISGATSNVITITNLSAANAGDYVVVVSNNFGAVTSIVARITVVSGPFITVQPVSQTNSGTLTAQFFVTALGDLPLAYQWKAAAIGSGGPYTNINNGGQVSGATSSNLTIASLAVSNSADYLVVVTNAFGAATSSVATLTVIDPLFTSQPQSLTRYQGTIAQFSAGELGTPPLINQWQAGAPGSGVYTNLTDGGQFSGSTTRTLTINNVDFQNQADYILILQNVGGVVTSSVVNLTIQSSSPAQNYTLDFGGAPIQQAAPGDWNTGGNWNPDGLPADNTAYSQPGSTYTVVAGARLRSPAAAIFTNYSGGSYTPGIKLIIAGDSSFTNNPGVDYLTNNPTMGELRFKHASPGTNYIRQLVMNGGQLDNGDNGPLVLQGQIDINATTPIYVDSAAAQDRFYQIDSLLTGTGTIEWRQFSAVLGGPDLNITCPSNTFSGQWHVFAGTLLGSGNNSLGTNSINVESGGALETLYNLNSPGANLIMNGQMFLHQNDTVRTLTVAGSPVPAGTYSAAQLNASYPGNFPTSWAVQAGSTATTASGSITVLFGPPIQPISLLSQPVGTNIVFSGSNGIPNGHYRVLVSTDVTLPRGSWTSLGVNAFDGSGNFSFTIPVNPAVPQRFFMLQQQVP